ncbi:MAG: B12-binding domain-containing radical SAM protein, partial [Theionarchaea archaeon]|nr:B12-binding domain-containing radical SAM protein [Theionarchaea archaeon]
QVDFRDYQLTTYENPLTQKSITDFLSDSEDILGIGCFFNALPFLLPSLKKIKSESPEKTIILGGPGPGSVAETLMEEFPFVDIVVKGEGEMVMRDMALDKPLNKIKGIVYRSQGKVVSTEERERIRNLDGLPFPDYSKIDLSKYTQAGVITARGCPYHCSFCEVAALWGYQTEKRSVSSVIKEIHMLYNEGVTSLHINDDTFVLDRKWVLNFCEALKREGIDMEWRCLGRINLMDRDLLESMAQSGCKGVQYGIESGSEQVLKKVGKQIDIPQIRAVIKVSVDCIEYVLSTFMWGFPFETMGDFYQTVYFMGVLVEMGSLVKLLFLSPAPLSPLHREYKNQLKFDEKFVPHLLWGVYKDKFSNEEKNKVFEMILQHPEVFSAFYYVDSPEVEKKYQILKNAGMIHE